ncbi:glutamate-cysteine ligase family protein [Dactylosporangium sp. NPDC051541]|uniref:glutamate-cysteine ligase family protein n=1 Tax=Dactylosporangium sp. NPDC051541 TaxID=3363977 RepID=UPI0037B79F6E
MSGNTGAPGPDLRQAFEAPPGRDEAVGLEVEVGLIHSGSRNNASYPQALAFLVDIVRHFDGEPLLDGANLVGVGLGDGGAFTLETGGALEYSSPPFPTVAAAVSNAHRRLEMAACVGASHGLVLFTGGITPFVSAAGIAWNPKPRVRIMREYFRGLGRDGAHADEVMGLILSAQTSLDYTDTDDLMTKLRLLVRASPVVAALFVNSPIAARQQTGALSRRMQYWRCFDPSRCGVLGFALDPGAGVEDLIDWAASLPMIYRVVAGDHVAAPPVSFRHAVERGFGDGTSPTSADWALHLSQVWPHVRVRHTLETRLADAPPWPSFGAGAALWAGLAYDPDARKTANDLLSGLSAAEIDRACVDVAVKGLSAMIGPYLVQDVARELLRLSRNGLHTRVLAGKEAPEALALLDPIDEVCDTMQTFADHALDAWNRGEQHFLSTFSIPVD